MTYDIDAANTAFTEIRQKQWPLPYGKILDTVAEHLRHSDFDEAEAACAAFLGDNE
jgi:hypothetical protein